MTSPLLDSWQNLEQHFDIWLKSLVCCHHVVSGSNHIEVVSSCEKKSVKGVLLTVDGCWPNVQFELKHVSVKGYISKMSWCIFRVWLGRKRWWYWGFFGLCCLLHPSPYALLTRQLFRVQRSLKVLKKILWYVLFCFRLEAVLHISSIMLWMCEQRKNGLLLLLLLLFG